MKELKNNSLITRIGSILICIALSSCTAVQPSYPAVEGMYVFDCGVNRAKDLSLWTPNLNVGKTWEFSNNCYLVKHKRGLLMWDTGLPDAISSMPNGLDIGNGAINARVSKTLDSQLSEIGIRPASIQYLALSHTHSDHVGNANYFTGATLYIQQAEFDFAFGPTPASNLNPSLYEKLRQSTITKLNGDHDLFGDGSVTIISTPGHTPGHQSLLVRLPVSGPVLLSGDMVHIEDNWTAMRVPSFNVNSAESLQSMRKIAALLEREKAKLWINHDSIQSGLVSKSPRFTR